jgi:hypothetical protein
MAMPAPPSPVDRNANTIVSHVDRLLAALQPGIDLAATNFAPNRPS